MLYRLGQIMVVLSLCLLFLAYSNFAPTSLNSDAIAGYVKNHFVREILFGLTLTIWSILLALKPKSKLPFGKLFILGSIVVFPFWIAVLFGWSTQGLGQVWGNAINSNAAYILHSSQVGLFLLGMLSIKLGQKESTS